jgi:hypothetical protein
MKQIWIPWNDTYGCLFLNSKGISPAIHSSTLWSFEHNKRLAVMMQKMPETLGWDLRRSHTNMKTGVTTFF